MNVVSFVIMKNFQTLSQKTKYVLKYSIHTPTVIRINPNFLGAQAEMAVRGSTAPRKLGLIKLT